MYFMDQQFHTLMIINVLIIIIKHRLLQYNISRIVWRKFIHDPLLSIWAYTNGAFSLFWRVHSIVQVLDGRKKCYL